MPDERARLVDQPVAGQDDLQEGVDVLTPAGRCSGAQGGVEATDGPQHRRVEGGAGARAELADGIGVERVRRRILLQVEDLLLVALVEATELLDPHLRLRVEFGRQDHPGHARHAGRCLEAQHEAA